MVSKIIGVVSFKGGVGKTVSALNIASALLKKGSKVLVIDFNFLSPNLHIYLGLFDPDINLKDVLLDSDSNFKDAIYEHKTGLHIVPCSFCKKVDLKVFKKKIDEIKNDYDYIILDSGTNYHDEVLPVFEISDEIIVVMTPDYPSLYTSLKLVEVAFDFNKVVRGVLINKKIKKNFELTKKDIEATLGLRVIGEIIEDYNILRSFSKFMPVVFYNSRNKNSKEYLRIASLIQGGENILEYGEVI